MSLTVGIAGLSGRFGRLVGEILLKRPASEVKLRGFCREPRKLAKSLSGNSRVEVIQGSAFDSSAARTFAMGCDVVVCCYLGDDKLMIDGQKLLVDACEAEGVSLKDHLDTKEHIKGVHVMVGAFMDTFFTAYFDSWDPEKKVFTFWGTGDEVLEFSSYRSSAEYTASVVLDRKAVGVQKFLGDRLSIKQILQLFDSQYGFKPELNLVGSKEDLYKHMYEVQEKEPDNVFKYMVLFYKYYLINGQTHLGAIENSKYPDIKPETFRDFLSRHTVGQLSQAVEALE
ncbi:uncharacterized protein NECHADRAFT_43674 [Fusarium vanettenii 77-13-4]|uniref:NAD(P)-binding domain-containing protein n=1 Tax=Fusarium vanettenii (strain ATCC MYA-4622 / CBS 123669 / FGSC 9596 / NRRL 45880 / 77-13-4) TaxID=660122 RepID=C7ZAN7_FUSV7|nr:uncharacterized protein NECHADRAFT_43674 [Fusarium vanettenii 77-13-4]EEU39711.1 hypothetical protein NECHADRAFT_43674 [Fusarium vanettenii 77-13-4]